MVLITLKKRVNVFKQITLDYVLKVYHFIIFLQIDAKLVLKVVFIILKIINVLKEQIMEAHKKVTKIISHKKETKIIINRTKIIKIIIHLLMELIPKIMKIILLLPMEHNKLIKNALLTKHIMNNKMNVFLLKLFVLLKSTMIKLYINVLLSHHYV